MLSGAMEKVAEQDIAPDTKILRLIETHLDSIKMVAVSYTHLIHGRRH